MAEICLRHDVLICSDEIHCDLVFSGHPHIPIAALSPEIAQHTITLMAPSKTYNIAGLHCSFAMIQNPALREQFLAAGAGWCTASTSWATPPPWPPIATGRSGWTRCWPTWRPTAIFCANTSTEHLPGIEMVVPEGTYLAWLDCRDTPIAEQPGRASFSSRRASAEQRRQFGPGGEGYVRLNFACPRRRWSRPWTDETHTRQKSRPAPNKHRAADTTIIYQTPDKRSQWIWITSTMSWPK